MKIIMYGADCTGDAGNCLYPHRLEITGPAELAAAVVRDHVAAKYKDSYRKTDNFEEAFLLELDCDNDHSDRPEDWITPEKLAEDAELADVQFAATPSRHNLLPKGNRSPRPRFHFHAVIEKCTSAEKLSAMKRVLQQKYSFFDGNALDATRFMFGSAVKAEDVFWHDGWVTIDEILPADFAEHFNESPEKEFLSAGDVIPEGSRNKTMSMFAAKVLKRYGLTQKSKEVYLEHAKKCDPPLEEEELAAIWNSACKFYKNKIMAQPGYVEPDEYNCDFPGSLKPEDYSDIGQAKVLAKEYGGELIYTSETDFLRYDGTVWVEDKQLAVGATVEFLDLQLQDAGDALTAAKEKLMKTGISEDAVAAGSKVIVKEVNTPAQAEAFDEYLDAAKYFAFVMKRRDMKYIASAMNVAKALLNRSINEMDRNPNLLNTPNGTYDLVRGIAGIQPHRAEDRITKLTDCSPGDRGEQIWKEALNLFFCNDDSLIRYVQRIVGMAAVGKVYQEHLIIAYGDGANGKSTFWNTIARALGTYSGKISAEVLAVGNMRNAKPEMAELKGKRLIIASEMEEGMRLNTGTVKQLCSIDPIQAEKKYEKPFSFIPTHTLVLYTNHLPRVGANDDGIWRRLIVIPFNAKITGGKDVKNYADTLFNEAGPAIMKWIVEGAKEAIALEFKWPLPKQVEDAISEYHQRNDWFAMFLEECCEVGEDYQEKSGAFYDEYRSYCARVGEYTRNSADFYTAVEKAGLERKRTATGRLILGARLKSEFLE